jgi:hypothetical protein
MQKAHLPEKISSPDVLGSQLLVPGVKCRKVPEQSLAPPIAGVLSCAT